MYYEEISHESPHYRAACTLRDAVLRRPIGLQLSAQDVAGEDAQHHFIGRGDGGEVSATVTFKPLSATHAKLRQMAVAPALHGQGVGAALVRFAEAAMKAHGFTTAEANARLTAQRFYEKLGYRTEGEPFEEVGLPTIRMTKEL